MAEENESGNDCSFADCENPASVRGLCRTHYIQKWRRGALPPRPITEGLVRVKFGIPRAFDKGMRKLAQKTGHSYSYLLRKSVKEFLIASGMLKPDEKD